MNVADFREATAGGSMVFTVKIVYNGTLASKVVENFRLTITGITKDHFANYNYYDARAKAIVDALFKPGSNDKALAEKADGGTTITAEVIAAARTALEALVTEATAAEQTLDTTALEGRIAAAEALLTTP
jgi:hypothetical protein